MDLDPERAKRQNGGQPSEKWRVAKTIKPHQPGAIKLGRLYGEPLLCVRYRENLAAGERMTTIELVVDRVKIQKRKDEVVLFKIKAVESDLQRIAKSKGAIYDGRVHMWKLRRSEVVRMGLRHRIAVSIDGLVQE
ncbi:MAG: hypothetical protein H7Y33_12570 [Cytophagales bacterium]|nr:hypothetical protein [Rhizobacter sp.]